MKRMWSVVIIFSMLMGLLPVITAFAEDKAFLTENFEGTDPLSGFHVIGNEDTLNASIVPNPDGGKCLKIMDSANPKAASISKSFDALSDQVVIEADIMADRLSNSSTAFYLYGTGNVNMIALSFTATAMSAFSGSTAVPNVGKIKANTWMRLKMMIDIPKNEYTVSLDDEIIVNRFAFRNAATDIVRLTITTPLTNSGQVIGYVDNLTCTVPEKVIAGGEEPMAMQTNMLPQNNFDITSIADGILLRPDCEIAYVNGKKETIDPENALVAPFIYNNRTFVPIRFIAQSLGGTVGYDEAKDMASITLGGNQILLRPGSTEITVNGQVRPLDVSSMLVENRTFVPLRAIAESFGKKVGYDPVGVVTISDAKEFSKEELYQIKNALVSEGEKSASDKYSAVYLSSRSYKLPDALQGGTVDAIKQFNPTTIRWAYIYEPNQIKAISKLGVSIETAVQDALARDPKNRGITPGRNSEDFEGKPIVVGHLASLPNVVCYNGPTYIEGALAEIKNAIENGATMLQHDDWMGNITLYNDSNGCFCASCMTKFAQYIKDKYSAEEIKAFGIEDIGQFNYRVFLQKKYGFVTNSDYKGGRGREALSDVFKNFQYDTMRNYYRLLKAKAKEYSGGKDIALNGNMGHVPTKYDSELFKMAYNFFDDGLGETDEEEYTDIADLITGANVMIGNGKTYTISPRSSRVALDVELERRAIAATYAIGSYFLVPWDVWLSRQPQRYFGTPSEYGDLYQFIRQYPGLFDKHESNPTVAIATAWSALSDATIRKTLKEISYRLFAAGVPYKVVVANEKEPAIALTSKSFEGVSDIITLHSMDALPNQDRQLLENIGIPITPVAEVAESLIKKHSRVQVAGTTAVYATLRETAMKDAVVHIINYKEEKAKDVSVFVSGMGSREVMLYRPGYNPIKLSAKDDKVVVPLVDEWAIIEIANEQSDRRTWSTYDVGMPSYASAVQITGNDIEMSANAPGFQLKIDELDTSPGDYLSFTYQTTDEMDFEAKGKLDKNVLSKDGITGLMVRDSISSHASFAAIAYSEQDGYRFLYREKYSTDCKVQRITAKGDYMKIIKTSDMIRAYVSEDDVNWTEAGSIKIAFSKRLVGSFLASNGIAVANGKISNVEVKNKVSAAKIKSITASAQDTKIAIGAESKTMVGIRLDNSEKASASNTKIEYKSSNEKVVAIDLAGLMKGVAEGEATISVKATFGTSSMEQSFQVACSKKVVVLDENFEDGQLGSAPANWQQYNNTVDAKASIENVPERNSKGIKLSDIGTGVLNVKKPFIKPCKGVLTVEFDYYKEKQSVKSDSLTCYIYANNVPLINLTVKSQNFVWETDGKILAPFEDGKWYQVQIVCDIPAQTAKVYINHTLVGENLQYKGPVESINQVMLGAGTGVPIEVTYFDNFKVYTGEPE